MFPYDGVNRPESKTTLMFRPVRQVAAPGIKSLVSNCIYYILLTMENLKMEYPFPFFTKMENEQCTYVAAT